MKHVVIIVLLFFSCTNFLICENRAAYIEWLNRFSTKLEDCGFSIDAQERRELNNLLEIKPKINTGKYYGEWFRDLFQPVFDDIGPVLDKNEILRLEFTLQAITDLKGSDGFYVEYLQYTITQLAEEFLPVYNSTEKKLAEFIKKAHPYLNSESNYEAWLNGIEKLKEDFSPNISTAEQFVIDTLMDLKPDPNSGDEGTIYQVGEETLLRIRYLILNNGTYKAVQEIDRILNSQK